MAPLCGPDRFRGVGSRPRGGDGRAHGIGSQVHYLPLHRQPFFRQQYGRSDLPGADAWYARALSLPLFVGMQDEDVDRVVDALHGLCEGR